MNIFLDILQIFLFSYFLIGILFILIGGSILFENSFLKKKIINQKTGKIRKGED